MPAQSHVVVVIILLAVSWACGDSSPTAPSPPATLPSLESMLADKVLGNAAAPITMIEYSSLTCSHCADFHAVTLPMIKSAYIDTGQVSLVYRDFPLDTTALSASMVARCSGDRFFTVIDLLYGSQAVWAGSSNTTAALKNAVAPSGMSGAEVDACLARTDLKSGIQAIKARGQADHGVGGTPTFIIRDRKVPGAYPFATFDAIFRELLQAG